MKEQKVLSNFWFWGLLILPILLYFLLIELYGMNVPYVDDHGLKGFLVKFQDSNKWEVLIILPNETPTDALIRNINTIT